MASVLKEKGWHFENIGNAGHGKFADSLDQFIFYYRKVDLRKENFCISASLEVLDAAGADYQTGYGIMLADTVANTAQLSRHRNQALLGRFRSLDGRNYCLGLRIVGGYTHPQALPQRGKRRLDPTRLFTAQPPVDEIKKGDRFRFVLKKTDEGLEASCETGNNMETIHFPGCDFLLEQDQAAAYVGFAIAGQVDLQITDVQFEKEAGRLSHTPEGAIGKFIPDYPFSRTIFEETELHKRVVNKVLKLNAGQDLEEAILSVGPGCEIVLADGRYEDGPYYVPECNSGKWRKPIRLRAEHPGKAVIEGSGLQGRIPAMTLRASYWVLDGLVFRGAPSSGLFVCGSYNKVVNCEAFDNGDTGILICSYPGSPRKKWPRNNSIEFCSSHDNCDRVRCNADGFGAKLSIGRGNHFRACKAFHNIDDGFDFYTKDFYGSIGAVRLADCEAYCNGWLSDDDGVTVSSRMRNGCGFKLGGERIQVHHLLMDCLAHDNAGRGFSGNSNKSYHLWKCKEWDNNKTVKR